MLTDSIKSEISSLAKQAGNEEVCGFIVKVGDELKVYPCQNISYHKHSQALVNPIDFIRASKFGRIIILSYDLIFMNICFP